MPSVRPPWFWVVCLATVATGTAASLIMKAIFQTEVHGKKYNAPFCVGPIVGSAMATSLLLVKFGCEPWAHRHHSTDVRGHAGSVQAHSDGGGDEEDDELSPLLSERAEMAARRRRGSRSRWWVLIIPAIMDLTVTVTSNLAYAVIPASVCQMVSSAGVVFVAILTRLVLGTRYTRVQWLGVALAAVGLGLTATSLLLSSEHIHQSRRTLAFGGAMVLIATLVSAAQWVAEERFLKRRNFTPMMQVGIEGTVELVLFATVVLPLVGWVIPGDADNGKVEDVAGAGRMLMSSPTLAGLAAAFYITLMLYNPLSQNVALMSGSTMRIFMSALRTIGVWAGGLLQSALLGGHRGEVWTPHSYLQLLGFGVLVVGLSCFAQPKCDS